jgi:hypothetical protein
VGDERQDCGAGGRTGGIGRPDMVEDERGIFDDKRSRALWFGFGVVVVYDAWDGFHSHVQDDRPRHRIEALAVISEFKRSIHRD